MAGVYLHDRDHIFRCTRCNANFQGKDEFCKHIRTVNHPIPLQCGECELSYEHLTSLIRHIKDDHNQPNPPPPPPQQPQQLQQLPADGGVDLDQAQGGGGAALGDENMDYEDIPDQNLRGDPSEDGEDDEVDLEECGGRMILNLRQTGGVTNASVLRCQEECVKMMRKVCINLKQKVSEFLTNANINTIESRNLLSSFVVEDPFVNLKRLPQQLNYFARKFGLVKPQTKFLGYRIDYRFNSTTLQYEPTQVPMSFQYVSLIDTLKLFMSNRKNRESVAAERKSDDGVSRTYLDGERAKVHTLVARFPNILRIQLYWDDVEVVNALGSKTTIHKLAAFYFSIENLPLVERGQLSSIFLLTLAFSEDLKGPHSFQKILAPFLYELRKLESEAGVPVIIDDEPVLLRATLTVLCADSLEAHEILGFLSPSARHFCRKCMISRHQFHQDLNAVGEIRTRAMFEEHVRRVKENPKFSTQCGLKATGSVLHASRFFDATKDAVFDIFHDLLEGVCHWDISLTLKSFIKDSKYFSLQQFNNRLEAFNYGVPDVKNKPSANFSDDSLKGKKLKQTGSQMWCLTRVFGFLVPEVPEENPHLKLVNVLQSILLIVFSEETREEHRTRLDGLVEQHHKLFQELHISGTANVDVNDLDLSDEEEDIDDPAEGVQPEVPAAPKRKVKLGNKLHHMKHLVAELLEYGNLIRYWCARYEARHHIFCKYGACCCNFINIVKSMAQMYQISTLPGILKKTLRAEEMELQSSEEISVGLCQHRNLLLQAGRREDDHVLDTDAVQVAGENYRLGLFVLMETATPTFGLIQNVYVYGTIVYLILLPWKTIGFEDRYCAYRVEPVVGGQCVIISQDSLPKHGSFAPWNPCNQRSVYIAPRTIVF